MEIVVRIPDNLAATLPTPNGDLARDVLEGYALEGYKSGKLTAFQVQELLGFETPMEVDLLMFIGLLSYSLVTLFCDTA